MYIFGGKILYFFSCTLVHLNDLHLNFLISDIIFKRVMLTPLTLGINDQQKNTETYEYFDSGTKKWAPGGPLLNKRSASCATLYEGIIYLAGQSST